MDTIKIGTIDTTPEHDPYHQGQCEPTHTVMHIAPANDCVSVGQEMDQGAVDADIWNGRIITLRLDSNGTDGLETPDAGDLRAYLKSEPGQALLRRIVDGYSIEWDGHNHVGSADDDSAAALEELECEIQSEVPVNVYSLYNADDYVSQILDDLVIDKLGRLVADRVLESRARKVEAEAEEGNVILAGDVLDALLAHRDEMREERA